MMKINRIDRKWNDHEYESAEFTDGGIDDLNKFLDGHNDFCIYDYQVGCFCGGGNLIFRKGGRWGHLNLSHCSCNGPLEDLDKAFPETETLSDLMFTMSTELAGECAELIEACFKIERRNKMFEKKISHKEVLELIAKSKKETIDELRATFKTNKEFLGDKYEQTYRALVSHKKMIDMLLEFMGLELETVKQVVRLKKKKG